jgi:hypothetical protein
MTEEQLKAIKSVERAIRKAYKLDLEFWSNYGRVTAYDKSMVTEPSPMDDDGIEYSAHPDERYFKELDYKIRIEMNADDTIYFYLK